MMDSDGFNFMPLGDKLETRAWVNEMKKEDWKMERELIKLEKASIVGEGVVNALRHIFSKWDPV